MKHSHSSEYRDRLSKRSDFIEYTYSDIFTSCKHEWFPFGLVWHDSDTARHQQQICLECGMLSYLAWSIKNKYATRTADPGKKENLKHD